MTFLEMMEKEIISAGKPLTIKEALNGRTRWHSKSDP